MQSNHQARRVELGRSEMV